MQENLKIMNSVSKRLWSMRKRIEILEDSEKCVVDEYKED